MAVEDKEERREEERARGELGMMEEVEGGEVKRRGSNCSSRTGCTAMRFKSEEGGGATDRSCRREKFPVIPIVLSSNISSLAGSS